VKSLEDTNKGWVKKPWWKFVSKLFYMIKNHSFKYLYDKIRLLQLPERYNLSKWVEIRLKDKLGLRKSIAVPSSNEAVIAT
jgi:hypothetical protein